MNFSFIFLSEMPNISTYNSDISKTVETIIPISDISKDLNGQLPAEIECELEELSPGMDLSFSLASLYFSE